MPGVLAFNVFNSNSCWPTTNFFLTWKKNLQMPGVMAFTGFDSADPEQSPFEFCCITPTNSLFSSFESSVEKKTASRRGWAEMCVCMYVRMYILIRSFCVCVCVCVCFVCVCRSKRSACASFLSHNNNNTNSTINNNDNVQIEPNGVPLVFRLAPRGVRNSAQWSTV